MDCKDLYWDPTVKPDQGERVCRPVFVALAFAHGVWVQLEKETWVCRPLGPTPTGGAMGIG